MRRTDDGQTDGRAIAYGVLKHYAICHVLKTVEPIESSYKY